jgi:hypothetical protein
MQGFKNSLKKYGQDVHKLYEPMINTKDAAEFLGVSVHFLYKDRASRKPTLEYVKVGTAVRYRLSILQAYIAANSIKPDAQAE